MKSLLIGLLESFKFPVYLQGTLAADAPYPDSFFTFWNNDTEDGHHYDDQPISFIWSFDVNFYSKSPALVETVPAQAILLLKQNGFIIGGRGHDLPSDEPTHTGRGFDALYIEKNTEVLKNDT